MGPLTPLQVKILRYLGEHRPDQWITRREISIAFNDPEHACPTARQWADHKP